MKFIKFILIKISRVIYWSIPIEFRERRKSLLEKKMDEETNNETLNHFREHFKKV